MQTEIQDRDGGFLFNVNLVFLSQIAIYGLAFGLRVVLARGLGDDGLGTYSLFFVAVLVASGIANLGVGLGNIYFLNKGEYSYETSCFRKPLRPRVHCVLGWLLLALYALVIGDELFVSGDAFWLYAAALPAAVAYVLLTSFLHGSSRFIALSIVAVTQGIAGLAIVGALYAADELNVFRALAAWAGSFLLADALALALVGVRRVKIGSLLRPRWDVLKEQIRYGAQGQMANMARAVQLPSRPVPRRRLRLARRRRAVRGLRRPRRKRLVALFVDRHRASAAPHADGRRARGGDDAGRLPEHAAS